MKNFPQRFVDNIINNNNMSQGTMVPVISTRYGVIDNYVHSKRRV